MEVIADFCKGCEICVVMCPRNVLEMRPDPTRWVGAIVEVVRPEACTRCMLCEVHCPDFAIKVY
ncbi:MAG: 4Fe-4S binding protein [candidate division KSB1 bacterium]|nr:4Fe-4S binding protein [candidate division KSB1 bacterium]